MPRPSSSRVLGVVKVCSYVYPLSNNHGSQGGSDASGYTNYPPRIWPTENFATSRPRWGFGAINHAHAAHTNLQDHAVMQDATGNHQASRGHQVCLSSPEGNAFRKADRAILQRRHYTELAAKRNYSVPAVPQRAALQKINQACPMQLFQLLCTSCAPRQSHRMKPDGTGVKSALWKGATESKERAQNQTH